MSGLEVVGAVSAVISAFHGGAELVKIIKKKHRRRKNKQAYQEEALQESLQNGERQVGLKYTTDFRELGPRFQTGDGECQPCIYVIESSTNCLADEARGRLLHIAVVMQAEIIRSLQIAIQYENAILDLTLLHETSVINRQNTIITLDGLRQRILQGLPIERSIGLLQVTEIERRPSIDSIRTYMTANTVAPAPDYVPPAVIIPDESEARNGLTRLLSRRSSSGRPIPQSTSRISLLPNFDWLGPMISSHEQQHEQDFVAACLRSLDTTQPSALDFNTVNRNDSTSTNSTSTRSGYSDKILYQASIQESSDSASPAHSQQAWSPNSLSPHPQDNNPTTDPFRRASSGRPAACCSSTISMPPSTTQSLLGRPAKDNNYWGFCKGAWSAREDLRKGLQIQTRPEGLYNTVSVWQCRSCCFEGAAFGARKPFAVDIKVRTAGNGIRSGGAFWAKGHVRRKSGAGGGGGVGRGGEEGSFGCVFCCGEGRMTGVYGNVETLMNLVLVEHAGEMAGKVQERTGCVVGRVAGEGEAWDINIPDGLAGYG